MCFFASFLDRFLIDFGGQNRAKIDQKIMKIYQELDSQNKYIFDWFLLGFLRLAGSAERPNSLKKNSCFSMILAFWLMIKMSSKSCQKESKNHWKIIENWSKNQSKIDPKRHPKTDLIFASIFHWFLIDFGTPCGRLLRPKSLKMERR